MLVLNCQVESELDKEFWHFQQHQQQEASSASPTHCRWVPLTIRMSLSADGELQVVQDPEVGRGGTGHRSCGGSSGRGGGVSASEGSVSVSPLRDISGLSLGGNVDVAGVGGAECHSEEYVYSSLSEDCSTADATDDIELVVPEECVPEEEGVPEELGVPEVFGMAEEGSVAEGIGVTEEVGVASGGSVSFEGTADVEIGIDACACTAEGGFGEGEDVVEDDAVSPSPTASRGEEQVCLEEAASVQAEEEEYDHTSGPEASGSSVGEGIGSEDGGEGDVYELTTVVSHVKEPWMETHGNLVAHVRVGSTYHMRKEVREG